MNPLTVRQEEARKNASEDNEVVFIVRVRRPVAATAVEIRGRVEHLQSRSSGYFKDWEALCNFMIENMHVGNHESS